MFLDREMTDLNVIEESVMCRPRSIIETQTPDRPPKKTAGPPVTNILVGEVIDTHHPSLRSYVLVRWFSEDGTPFERWLKYVRGATPRRGDRVLIDQPGNWPEKLVIAIIDGGETAEAAKDEGGPDRSLHLEGDQHLHIADKDGKPLVDIYPSSQGPVIHLLNENAEIEMPGKLRFKAKTIELEAGRGGIDIRTEADTVVRSRYIRLN